MDRQVTPPTWGPPPSCKQALKYPIWAFFILLGVKNRMAIYPGKLSLFCRKLKGWVDAIVYFFRIM